MPYLQRTRDFPNLTRVTMDMLNALSPSNKRYLLVVNDGMLGGTEIRQYLDHGIAAGVNETYLASARPQWFDLSAEVSVPDIIISAAARTSFALLENDAGAAITNNLYGLTWLDDTPLDARVAIVDWLRSEAGQSALSASSRAQAEGLIKLDVRTLAGLLIPATVTCSNYSPLTS